jgi:hypothetical protein
MRDDARRVLVQLVKEYGPAVAEDPDRFRGLFLDYAPVHVRFDGVGYIHALTKAAQAGIVDRMLVYQPPGPSIPTEFIQSLTQELQTLHAGPSHEAVWACQAWAVALRLIDEPPPEPIQVIGHDPLPAYFPATPVPVQALAGHSHAPRQVPAPLPPQPPPFNPPPPVLTPLPVPLPPSVPAPPPLPPTPRAALDWITPRIIDSTLGGGALVISLVTLDMAVLALIWAFPPLANFPPMAIPWLVVVFVIWDKCAKLANLPSDQETYALFISCIAFLSLSHWPLWHIFSANFPGYATLWMLALQTFMGLSIIVARHNHTPQNKLIQYTLITLGTLLLGVSQLDVGITLIYHCPLWAIGLALCWAWPFGALFQRSREPTTSVLTIWTVLWITCAFFGQWALFYWCQRHIPGWEVWVLTGLHLVAAWILVWIPPVNRTSLRRMPGAILLAILAASALSVAGHALFQKT